MNVKNSYNNESSWQFDRVQLARMLADFRRLYGVSRATVQTELVKFMEKYRTERAWDRFLKLAHPQFGGSLTKLESPARDKEPVVLPDIEPLVQAYNAQPLMFISLLSEPKLDKYLAYNLSRDFMRVGKKAGAQYGVGARYWIPKTTLRVVDNISIVYHELDPKKKSGPTHSVRHKHPGDELIYIEEGSVEIWLENMGLRVKLDEGDFIQFDAEQLHSAWNYSNVAARMFIVRFVQPHSGTRLNFFKELKASKHSDRFKKRIIEETRSSVWSKIERQQAGKAKEIYDRYGLGRFLELVSSESFRGTERVKLTFDELYNRSKAAGYDCSRSKLARLQYGETQIKKKEIPILAKIYDIESILLYDFLFPAFKYAIAVRKEDMRIVPEQSKIMEDVVYKVPCRRLAHSDVTIAVVELKPRASTVMNRHPGCELLRVAKGEVAVELDNKSHPPINEGEYAYYCSRFDHRVYNTGEVPAEVLFIRFLD